MFLGNSVSAGLQGTLWVLLPQIKLCLQLYGLDLPICTLSELIVINITLMSENTAKADCIHITCYSILAYLLAQVSLGRLTGLPQPLPTIISN